MKKMGFILFLMVVLFGAASFAAVRVAGRDLSYSGYYLADRGLGVGVIFGSNTALSVKDWVNKYDALQFDLGWDFIDGDIGIGAAYLIHNFDIIEVQNNKVPLYFGIKGWANISSGAMVGIQVPLGIDWIFKTAPIDLFLQIEPGIEIFPKTQGAGNGGIGARYWFR
jgi:hypothetical protein